MENKVRYNKIVGTGGIGIGMLFYSEFSETLGRSESRMVLLSDAKDYCKQHIVFYYVAILAKDFSEIIPIGFVGDDANGRSLIAEMQREGMNTKFVGKCKDEPTMLSICLQYPDKEGCNFTAKNNASAHVTPEYIDDCLDQIGIDDKTIIAVIPEVSAESRLELLKKGREHHAFNVLSVPVAEADFFAKANAFSMVDLLAVNEGEAQAILQKELTGEKLSMELYQLLSGENPEIVLLVTCGAEGAYSVVGGNIEFIPPLPGNTINTTGAGDAFLGGTLAGIAKGLKIQKGHSDKFFGETTIRSAVELGTLCAGMAVESKDSIAFEVTPEAVNDRIIKYNWSMEPWFIN